MYNTEDYKKSTINKAVIEDSFKETNNKHPNSMIYMPELLQPETTARVNKSYVLKHPLSGFTSSPKSMGKSMYGGVFKKETTDINRIMMKSP